MLKTNILLAQIVDKCFPVEVKRTDTCNRRVNNQQFANAIKLYSQGTFEGK